MASVPTSTPGHSRTAAARAEHIRRAAERAVDDPRQLARAARIVRAALARKALEPADILEGGAGDDRAA